MIAGQVSRYITENNPPWAWPYRFSYGLLYQLFKRSTHRPITKTLFNGYYIRLHPDCRIASQFVYAKIPDKREIMKLRQVSCQNTTFIDIGANMGAYSLMLLDKVKRVIAFEPDQTSFTRLKDNMQLNSIRHAHLEKLALSNYVGEGKFSNMSADPTNKLLDQEADGITVRVCTLDDYAYEEHLDPQKPYIIKIDVEGEELHVLQGARNFLNRYNIKGIVFESFQPQIDQVQPYLEKLGFKVERLSHHNYWASKA